MLIVVLIIAAFNVLLGFCVGYASRITHEKDRRLRDEKEIYCHGFEDGIYYTIDEYRPELYRPEIAEQRYKEYKAIKYGPEKH